MQTSNPRYKILCGDGVESCANPSDGRGFTWRAVVREFQLLNESCVRKGLDNGYRVVPV
jgi:hypothetical protein